MRRISIVAILGGLAIVGSVIGARAALATPPSGVGAPFTVRATLDRYHFDSDDFKIFQKDREDVVMRELTIAAGGDSGWHTHPGPALVIITQGTGSLYEGDDPMCMAQTFGPGQGFVEQPGMVHILRNEGATQLVLFVTFLNVPIGGGFRSDAPRPGNCLF